MNSKTGYAILGSIVAIIVVVVIVLAVRGPKNVDLGDDSSISTLDRGNLNSYSRDELDISEALVDSVSVQIMESFPVQAQVSVAGTLRNGCEEIYEILSRRDGSTFYITLNAAQPQDAVCTQVVREYSEVFPLDIEGLPAGTYTVIVNGVSTTFTLDADNMIDMEQVEGK